MKRRDLCGPIAQAVWKENWHLVLTLDLNCASSTKSRLLRTTSSPPLVRSRLGDLYSVPLKGSPSAMAHPLRPTLCPRNTGGPQPRCNALVPVAGAPSSIIQEDRPPGLQGSDNGGLRFFPTLIALRLGGPTPLSLPLLNAAARKPPPFSEPQQRDGRWRWNETVCSSERSGVRCRWFFDNFLCLSTSSCQVLQHSEAIGLTVKSELRHASFG